MSAAELPGAPPWRSFQLFNGYRLLLALLLAFMPLMAWFDLAQLTPAERQLIYWGGGIYIVLVGLGLVLSLRWRERFQLQLMAQMLVDAVAVNLLMFFLGGVKSGLGVMLLVSVAGASLVAHGRLALFYAALATLSVLCAELLGVLTRNIDTARLVQAGFLSMGFFATAISAHLLGRRLATNEDLARRRGIELENQMRISRRVMERMQDGVLVVDVEGRILQSNPRALAILGPQAEVGGWLASLEPDLARGYQAWRAQKGPKRVEIARPAGRELAARFVRTRSTDGAALVFLEDLGKLREQAQQMKLASLGRLTASIAHEIRNPLSAISHAGDLLAEEARGPMQERLLRIIRDNTQRLDRVIQDVLVLGRQRAVEQVRIALRPYLEGFVQEILAQGHLPASVIVLRVPEGASLCFEPGQLHQVLWNLVGNALRHSSRSPGAVRLEVRQAGDGVELHVIDDGPGIPRELREQIFEPFFTTAARGTGLGLHIARELSEANGARLFLGSEGPGGHFVLRGRNEPCQSPALKDGAGAP
ncbi:MAG: ATP-binding protein [Azovibrio sp.]|nr:ATP-binding protein [Azovibrio sp.]